MKVGIFADPHYCGSDVLCKTRRPRLSYGKIRETMDAFAKAGVDRVVCMGDLTDREATHAEELARLREVTGLIRSYGLPALLIPGNHDYASFTAAELTEIGGFRIPPYTVPLPGCKWIVLDANYRSDGRRFDIAGVDWKDSNLPPEQLAFLRRELATGDEPCVVLVHENLDPEVQRDHIIRNAGAVRQMLADSGRVKLVLQGHYHPGAEHTLDGIRYLTLPAMCEGESVPYRILDL